MSVAALFGELQARGIALHADGEALRIKGPQGSWEDLREQLRASKVELLAVAQEQAHQDVLDWRAFFEERVSTSLRDARMTREQAERLAHVFCRLKWSTRNPPPDPGEGLCVHCQKAHGGIARKIDTSGGFRYLHPQCSAPYADARQRLATATLLCFGIGPPPG